MKHSLRLATLLNPKDLGRLSALILVSFLPYAGWGAVHYVDCANASPVLPFTDWATAARTIQEAVDAASPGDEILVTNGIYATGRRPAGTNTLMNRVTVEKPLIIRSVNGPVVTVIKGDRAPSAGPADAATRCVYLCSGALLSGFTLTNGSTRLYDYDEPDGGGVWCQSESAFVTNCVITGSYAAWHGGGAYGGTLENCTLSGNRAHSGGGAASSRLVNCTLINNPGSMADGAPPYYGGGAYNSALTNCTVRGNLAQYGGGAYNSALTNCTVGANSAPYGGGVYLGTLYNCTVISNWYDGAYWSTLNNCTVTGNQGRGAQGCTLNNCTLASNLNGGATGGTLNNCLITGNSAESGGGAYGSTLNNCTLTGNSARYGGGTCGGTLNNCLVYFNDAVLSGPNYHESVLNSCCTTPLPGTGTGNITNAPGLLDSWRLSSTSACRGAGSAAYVSGVDLEGEPWLTPPSIGCDEYYSHPVGGPLSASIMAVSTNVALAFSAEFEAVIGGKANGLSWEFGDGTVISNQLCVFHSWTGAGDYSVVLRAYNDSFPEGVKASLIVHVLSPATHFVAVNSTNPVPPFTDWSTAANSIQDAVDAASVGGVVLVNDGTYDTGGRSLGGNIRARVIVDKPLTLRSVHGPELTAIRGHGAVRCVYLTGGTILSGFTLADGAADGTSSLEQVGGGVLGGLDALVTNCTINGNSASSYGGGVYGGTINNCTLSNNASGVGGAAYGGTLSNCTVVGNMGSYYGGGVAYCTVNSCVVTRNSAGSRGGGAYLGTLADCTLSDNSANEGGAVYESIVNRSTIRTNSAYDGGGSYGGTLNSCIVRGNIARSRGGGTYGGQLDDCVIYGNSGPEAGGAYSGRLTNCTVVGNSAEGEWGAGGTLSATLFNCIVYYNTARLCSNYSGGTWYYSCTSPFPSEGRGNISNEPQFLSLAEGDFRLATNSPCINVGENQYAPGATDIDGNSRIVSGAVDMGAYEYQTVILSAPSIVSQPASLSVVAGETANFAVKAKGYPLNYQWLFNGANIPGATLSSLRLEGVLPSQSGDYSVVVANSFGTVTSTAAVLSVVGEAPTARVYLSSGHTPTTIGSAICLYAHWSGTPQPSFQWQFNGANLQGRTEVSLSLTNLQPSHSGNYTVVASNILGVVTSAVAVVTVVEPVPVLAYYANTPPPLMVGSYQSLCAEVFLSEPAALQWTLNGTNLINATNNCFSFYPVQARDAGDYAVVATTVSGVYTSPPVSLRVYWEPPSQATPRFSQGSKSALVGQDVRLFAGYSGSPCDLQWRFNGADLPAETNRHLALLAATTDQAGQYSFTASNVAGMVTSTVATLSVSYQPPVFAADPTNQSVVEGSTVRFQAYALAGPPPVYFLQHNGTNVAVPRTFEEWGGESTGGFTLLDTTLADAGSYRVIATNDLGSATSAVATLTVRAAGPLDRWTQRSPLPQSNPILAVAHSTNQFVAVGERGTILTSANGANWALQNRRVDLPLNGVAYGNGLFVAAGLGGTILSSSDGSNWTYRYTAADTDLNAVAYGNGRFVVVGTAPWYATLVLYSTNGINWEAQDGVWAGADHCVTFASGLFVAGGSSCIMVSSNGVNWTLAQNASTTVETVGYGDGKYVAMGNNGLTLVSTDGFSWVSRPPVTTRRLLGVTYGAGRFVAAGARGTMLTSTDALTWTEVPSGTPDRLETIDYFAGLFTAAGEHGTILTSTNGTTWAKQNLGTTLDLDGMEVGNGTIVVVGKGGTILTSTDGTSYTARDAGVSNDLHGVTWGGGLWVAVGEPGTVLTSTNAVDWASHPSGTTNSLKDGTYANGQWIVVGTKGTVVRSTDGVTWSATYTSPAYDLNEVAYGNGVFLIAGDGPDNQNGSLFRSVDGTAWTQVQFYPGKNLRGVTFANGVFLFAANNGFVFASTNGTAQSFHIVASLGDYVRIDTYPGVFVYGPANLRAVTWAGGLWTVVGNYGTIFTSADMVSWTRRPSRMFENLHQAVYLDGKLVVIGNRGNILQSGRFVTEFESPSFVGTGLQLPLKGIVNQPYDLQATTNLVDWFNLANFTNRTEHTTLTDTNALQHAQRSYRLMKAPGGPE